MEQLVYKQKKKKILSLVLLDNLIVGLVPIDTELVTPQVIYRVDRIHN